jgi:hypothetical protein
MATYLITHEVDDVEHWWNSPKRAEAFGSLGIQVRTFRDPAGSNKVGLLAEIPDFAAFEAFMKTDAAAAAVRDDGVRLETMVLLAES